MKYVGWIFTTIALVGTFLNAQMNVLGFFAWIISNIGFMVLNLLDRSYPEATLFFINTLFSMWGIYTWKQKQKENSKKVKSIPADQKS